MSLLLQGFNPFIEKIEAIDLFDELNVIMSDEVYLISGSGDVKEILSKFNKSEEDYKG